MTSFPAFGATTPVSQVCEVFSGQVAGKTVLVTGVSHGGLGFAAAVAFVACGARLVIISGRSPDKLEQFKLDMQVAYPSVLVRTLVMDLAVQRSVYKAAQEVNSYSDSIDIMINNAGTMAPSSRQLTVDGIEETFATNHLGHFFFLNLIIRRLQASAATQPPGSTRIVNLTSEAHKLSPVRFHDISLDGKPVPDDEQPDGQFLLHLGQDDWHSYNSWTAYGQSKTANILTAVALRNHFPDILSFAVHPGVILSTNLARNMTSEEIRPLAQFPQKTLEQGTSTILVAALDPQLSKTSPVYLRDCQFAKANQWATDKKLAAKLWELSEELVGRKFIK